MRHYGLVNTQSLSIVEKPSRPGLQIGSWELFIKYYQQGQLSVVNSALTSLTKARTVGAPTRPPPV